MSPQLALIPVVVIVVYGRLVYAKAEPSFWDGVPLISQIKSLVQTIAGDKDGAEKTKKNYLNQAPIVSQIKSVVELIHGNHEAAINTQKKFLNEFIEPLVDNTPGVGHIKGAIHSLAGDAERGRQAFNAASSSTGALIGGILGGPGGALAGKLYADQIITHVDTAISNKYKPYGVLEYAHNIDKKSVGDHFDMWTGFLSPLRKELG